MDIKTRNLLAKHTKDWPKCESTIQKSSGCCHMTCVICRYEFCWRCLKKWSRRTQLCSYAKCNRRPARSESRSKERSRSKKRGRKPRSRSARGKKLGSRSARGKKSRSRSARGKKSRSRSRKRSACQGILNNEIGNDE